MDIFTEQEPNLIGPKVQKTVYKIIESKPTVVTVSDKVSNTLSNFYTDYIEQNKFAAIFILLVIVFLVYRYYNRSPPKESFTADEYKILKKVLTAQTANLRYDTQPSMNPLYPVVDQKERVFYPPDPLPINIPDKGFVYTRDLYDEPKPFEPINAPKGYRYDNVYTDRSRSYYNGAYNTYKNAKDTNIINPLGFSNQFNSNTGAFVGGMTNKNNKVLKKYQAILDNTEGTLIDSLKQGSKHMDLNTNTYGVDGLEIDPPYATTI